MRHSSYDVNMLRGERVIDDKITKRHTTIKIKD